MDSWAKEKPSTSEEKIMPHDNIIDAQKELYNSTAQERAWSEIIEFEGHFYVTASLRVKERFGGEEYVSHGSGPYVYERSLWELIRDGEACSIEEHEYGYSFSRNPF